jgi:hypothetical protein
MRFTKILSVCLGLVLLAGATTHHVAGTAKPLQPVITADGTEPPPIPPLAVS